MKVDIQKKRVKTKDKRENRKGIKLKIENREGNAEKPEECESCGYLTKNLKRFYYYGPGHNADWLCPYCSLINSDVAKTMAGMFNELEERLRFGSGDINES